MKGEVSAVTERAGEVLKPLRKAEAERAVRAALDRVGAEEPYLRGYELLLEKAPRRGGVPLRRVRVLVGEAARDIVYDVIIDSSGKVVSSERREGENFPLLREEVERAEGIAARDKRVAQVLRRSGVRAGAFEPSAHEDLHRLVGLHYMTMNDPAAIEPVATAVVDLASEEVVSFALDQDGGDPRSGG
jgi:hypothetical protein